MSLLAPTLAYHAELREQLHVLGRALLLGRALAWAARGLVAGLVALAGYLAWLWSQGRVAELVPLVGLGPIGVACGCATASLFVRQRDADLARQVDRRVGLQERAVTAFELGTGEADSPLALLQMRDTVEHLRRLSPMETFPARLPRWEVGTSVALGILILLLALTPNPLLQRGRAPSGVAALVQEQARRVERLADSVAPPEDPAMEQLRNLLREGSRTLAARAEDPEAALGALEDLEAQVNSLAAGDDGLAAALATIASVLAADPATSALGQSINTGDLREVARQARALAEQVRRMDATDRERLARTLRDASGRIGRSSPALSRDLAEAASALGDNAGAGSGNDDTPSGALDRMAGDASAMAERQRAQAQLESGRNALERALGRTQSQSGPAPGTTGQRSSAASRGDDAFGDSSAFGGGDGSDPDEDGSGSARPGGTGSSPGSGGGDSNRSGATSPDMDVITRAEQVSSGGILAPDQTSIDPFLSGAGDGSSRLGDEDARPSFSARTTQAGSGDSGSIPAGLRDLVKDYFNALDQGRR